MLILVYGDDAFRVSARARELQEKFVEKYDPSCMNVDRIVFSKKDDVDIAAVSEAISAAPFLSSKRFVRVDGVFSCVTTKPEAPPWEALCKAIPESSIVVFVDRVSQVAAQKIEVFKRIAEIPGVISYAYSKMTGGELRTWVIDRAKENGGILVPAVADALIRAVGEDSWRLETEIQKLVAYAGGVPIDEEMISTVVSREYSENMFGFIDALSGGNSRFALERLHQERAAGAEEFPLFGMLARQIRLILQARAMLEASPSLGKEDVATAFGLHPFVAQKVLAEARKFSFERASRLHALTSELDIAMKRGLSPALAVDRLVVALLDAS